MEKSSLVQGINIFLPPLHPPFFSQINAVEWRVSEHQGHPNGFVLFMEGERADFYLIMLFARILNKL